MKELQKNWDEYVEYLEKYNHEYNPIVGEGYFTFFWFMKWLNGGKKFGSLKKFED